MTQPYKVCPQCQTPALLQAPACAACGRLYQHQSPKSSFGPDVPSYAPEATPPYVPSTPYVPPTPYMPQYAPVPRYVLTPQEVHSKKIIAGIMGIVLGSLGIHKFIIGKTQAGVIMLLVSVLTLGIAAPVMHLIGLVEGILYLTKSDAEFYQTYLVGSKEWL